MVSIIRRFFTVNALIAIAMIFSAAAYTAATANQPNGLLSALTNSRFMLGITFISFGVIVTGPLFSLSASGQLGKSLVYSEWNGRKYVREYVIPNNPNSISQFFQRQFFAGLSKWWSKATVANRATWQALADAGEYSTFNAYCSTNLDNETIGLMPQTTSDETGGSVGSTTGPEATAVGGIGELLVTITMDAAADPLDLQLVSIGTAGGAAATAQTIQRTIFAGTNYSGPTVVALTVKNLPPGAYRLAGIAIGGLGDTTAWNDSAAAYTVT